MEVGRPTFLLLTGGLRHDSKGILRARSNRRVAREAGTLEVWTGAEVADRVLREYTCAGGQGPNCVAP